MLDILSVILKIVFIVFFFGFCVFFHEFGHLVVALWQGLHVEKFSVGMGPKLCGFHYKGVEYVISWLPIGGYVSLPQLDPTDSPVTSDGKPLPLASPKARALTAFAGPAFNVIFGFILAAIMWGAGLWRPTPSTSVVVGAIPAYLPYSGDVALDARILAVNGEPVPEDQELTWMEFCYQMGEKEDVPQELTLTIRDRKDTEARDVRVTPEMNQEWIAGLRSGDRVTRVNGKAFTGGTDEFQKEYVYGNTGHVTLQAVRDGQCMDFSYSPQKNKALEGLGFPFFESCNPVQLAEVTPGSPAGQAGICSGDQLLSLGGKNVLSPADLMARVQALAGQEVPVVVAREGKELPPLTLRIPAVEVPSEQDLGISFYVLITSVVEDSPAEKAGLQYGDRLLHLEQLDAAGNVTSELQVKDVAEFQEFVRNSQGLPLRITLQRDGKDETVLVTPYENPDAAGKYVIGVIITGNLPKSLQHVDPWTQFTEIISTTTRTLGLLFAPITSRAKSLVTGKPREVSQTQIGVRHMSGPVGIIYALWAKLKMEGYRGGFSFIILITFSLAFMNLLPLPVLDGGHIVFALIEGITRRRLPAVFFKYLYNTFAILLIALMLYITLFDGRRILDRTGITGSKEETTAPEVQKEAPDQTTDADTKEAADQTSDAETPEQHLEE